MKNPRRDDDVGSAGIQPCPGVIEVDPTAKLQSFRVGLQSGARLSLVSRTKQDHMTAFKSITFVQPGIPRCRPVSDEIYLQIARLAFQRAAHELFHLAFVEVNAWTKHYPSVRTSRGNSNCNLD